MTEKNIDCSKLSTYKYTLAIWTDHADFITDRQLADEEKLLELRCFDEKGEYRAVRDIICKDFTVREITGEENKTVDGLNKDVYSVVETKNGEETLKKIGFVVDEDNYLDIDTARGGWEYSAGAVVYATGGGNYHIPVQNADRITVRNYYKFDELGMAYKYDSRLVGFKQRGDN